jgi:hypothetical protein
VDQALDTYNRLLAALPAGDARHLPAVRARAALLGSCNRLDAALADLDAICAADRDDMDARYSRACLRLSLAARRRGEGSRPTGAGAAPDRKAEDEARRGAEAALRDLDAVVAADPAHCRAMIRRRAACALLGRPLPADPLILKQTLLLERGQVCRAPRRAWG